MTKDATPNLAMFLHTLAADVAAGAPRPYQLSIPVDGTAEMQIWPDHDRETGVALWGRVLGADTIRVEHGWGSTGSVHYSVSGDYCPGWTLKVWTAGTVEQDKSVAHHPLALYLDRLDRDPVPAAFVPEVELVVIGDSKLYMHTCGHLEWLSDAQRAEMMETACAGGCDACESGSDNPLDWSQLYVSLVDDRAFDDPPH
jgi:hypothetical protein